MHSVICSGPGSLECFVITKCTKFGQLILRKIIKTVATRCQIFRLGLRPGPRRGAYSAPADTLAEFNGSTSKDREGWEGKGEGRGREGKRSHCFDFAI